MGVCLQVLLIILSLRGQLLPGRTFFFSNYTTNGLADAQSVTSKSPLTIPGLNTIRYIQEGDINIGSFFSLTQSSGNAAVCSNDLESSAWRHSERAAFGVDYVNQHPTLLKNARMGFVVLDHCSSTSTALAQSLAFLTSSPVCQNNCSSSCSADQALSYDVIGTVGFASSRLTVPVSTLYSVARLPIVGYVSTSDELSDKTQHPFFFRVVPPDKHQVDAMLEFISENDWSYISVVFSQGSYGEKAFDYIKSNIDKYGICIATNHRLTSSADYDFIVSDLVEHFKARAVILFIDTSQVKNLFHSLRKLDYTNHFIWIGSDAWSYSYDSVFRDYHDIVLGAFSFSYYSTEVPTFYDYLLQQTVSNSSNPFLKTIWEKGANCSFSAGTCDPNQTVMQNGNLDVIIGSESLYLDAVLTFAHAADDLLRAECPDARGEEARACITGDLLQKYLKNVSFDGFTGHVKFDQHHDVKGKYEIRQLVYDFKLKPSLQRLNKSLEKGVVGRVVAIYDMASGKLAYTGANVSWSHLRTAPRMVPLVNNFSDDIASRPESVCSRPCLEREYKIELDMHCCWECRRCRDNERLNVADTTCEACPIFTWPEPSTGYTTCALTPLTYQKVQDTLPIILICSTITAFLFTVLVILAYVKYRNERVIKAASRELSFVQLGAILLGYLTVIFFQLKPTDVICKLMYFLFCMTFAILYSPLLVKTVRIYRIFRSASKDNRRPRFVSPQSQVAMSFCLIALQVLLCIVTDLVFNPTSRRHQPVWSEKLVELTCNLTVPGLTSFLAYNLVLVTLCSLFAFKTRKLPDNFNESRFISMCVYTTLVIWLAFVPTYFTAGRVMVQGLLLSVALLLNHSVALLFLFVPKIYAAVYVPPEQLNFVTQRFQTQHTFSQNRVAPVNNNPSST